MDVISYNNLRECKKEKRISKNLKPKLSPQSLMTPLWTSILSITSLVFKIDGFCVTIGSSIAKIKSLIEV